MPDFHDQIPDDGKTIDWVKEQKIFHVATAPLHGGRVNVSPKGQQCFKLVSRKACWYVDLTGSGNETISHIYEPGNGRVTIMFQAFEGPPLILRLYGKGTVYEKGSPEFSKFFEPSDERDELDFPTPEIIPGARAVIWVDIDLVGTSCGFAVPIMKFERHRDDLSKGFARLEARDTTVEDPYALHRHKGLRSWWVYYNTWSVDGLPGMKREREHATLDSIHGAMIESGLKLTKSSTTSPALSSRELVILLLWLLLGIVGSLSVAQRSVSLSPFSYLSIRDWRL